MNDSPSSGTVAIVTLIGKTNYGNRLQNYAAAQLYSKLGYETTTIIRRHNPRLSRRALEGFRRLFSVNQVGQRKNSADRLKAFERFDSSLRFSIEDEDDRKLADRFDFFSVGSDQVWNLGRMSDNDRWYYLQFARPEQRIALAPSIGVSELNHQQMKRLKVGVSNFRKLSVREERGAELIKRCSGRNALVVCDPTMALSSGEWRGAADSRCTPTEPYVFTYLLGGKSEESKKAVLQATKNGKLPVIPLSDREESGEPPAGPAEFISLIDNAVHVVTDSFHAAVFASILETPLTIVRREGGTNMFSRLETLAHMLGIEDKIFGSPGFDIEKASDFRGVSESIRCEREKLVGYLEDCLNG